MKYLQKDFQNNFSNKYREAIYILTYSIYVWDIYVI